MNYQKKISAKSIILFLVSTLIAYAVGTPVSSTPLTPSHSGKREPAKVIHVIDGDTLIVNYKNSKETVRLIGIDAPESHENEKAIKESKRQHVRLQTILAQGKESTDFLRSILKPGDQITLEFDVEARDKYGRMLAYAYTVEGKMIEQLILRAGYAKLLSIPPDIAHADLFTQDFKEARRNKRGLWAKNN